MFESQVMKSKKEHERGSRRKGRLSEQLFSRVLALLSEQLSRFHCQPEEDRGTGVKKSKNLVSLFRYYRFSSKFYWGGFRISTSEMPGSMPSLLSWLVFSSLIWLTVGGRVGVFVHKRERRMFLSWPQSIKAIKINYLLISFITL